MARKRILNMALLNQGMVTGLPPHLIPLNAAELVQNIEFDRLGGFRAVKGETTAHLHSSAEDITSIMPFTKMSGTKVLYGVEDTLYEWDTVGSSASSVSTAFTSGFHPHHVIYADTFFGYVYDSAAFRYDGSDLYLAGIPGPTATPSITAGTNGALASGTYLIYYSFYDSTNDREGNLSPAGTAALTGAQDQIDVGGLSAYATARYTHDVLYDQKRIYRSPLGGADAFLATTIASSATSASLTASSQGVVEHPNTYGLPPEAKYVAVWEGRVWAANIPDDKSNVYFSAALYPERWDTASDYLYLGGDSPTEIVGLKVMQGRLFIFTRNRIFQIMEVGAGSGNYYLLPVFRRGVLLRRQEHLRSEHIHQGLLPVGLGET
jgi:hypothetical protein